MICSTALIALSKFAISADQAEKQLFPERTMEPINILLERLSQIEAKLDQLVEQRSVKDWYTTAEVAEIVGRAEYTVREWCRKGQVNAAKALNGRGWLISHAEVERIRNHGPDPEPRRD